MTALSTKAFCKQIINTITASASGVSIIKQICDDNKHSINVILKNYKKYCLAKITGQKAILTQKKEKAITMNTYIEYHLSIEFESELGLTAIAFDIDEFTEISKQFPGITLEFYSSLSDDDKETICCQSNLRELYKQLKELKFKPAQIKAIMVRIANHISLPIIAEDIDNSAKKSPKKSPIDAKSPKISDTPKRKGLNKLRSFQSYIMKDGFFKSVDDINEDDITVIRKFIEDIPGENIVKMTNIWKTLTPEEKGQIDEFYASFPEIDESSQSDKTQKAKIAAHFFLENAVEAIAIFKKICVKDLTSGEIKPEVIAAVPKIAEKKPKTKLVAKSSSSKLANTSKKQSPFTKGDEEDTNDYDDGETSN